MNKQELINAVGGEYLDPSYAASTAIRKALDKITVTATEPQYRLDVRANRPRGDFSTRNFKLDESLARALVGELALDPTVIEIRLSKEGA